MDNLFETAEAEAARQLFYFLADRDDVTEAVRSGAWQAADLGVAPRLTLTGAIAAADRRKAVATTTRDESPFKVYNLQRQFIAFLEDAACARRRVPGGRGEVVFYNLGKFSQAISDFESIHFHSNPVEKYATFAGFLEHHADNAYPEGWQDNAFVSPDAVRIMTVHQAKGLQWPVVFIPQLVKNRFPSASRRWADRWHLIPDAAFDNAARYEGGLEDERRLFYVAATRAQKFLHLTWAPIAGNKQRTDAVGLLRRGARVEVREAPRTRLHRPRTARRRRRRPSVANVSLLVLGPEVLLRVSVPVQAAHPLRVQRAAGRGAWASENRCTTRWPRCTPAHRAARIARRRRTALVERTCTRPYAYPALREKLEQPREDAIEGYIRQQGTDSRTSSSPRRRSRSRSATACRWPAASTSCGASTPAR